MSNNGVFLANTGSMNSIGIQIVGLADDFVKNIDTIYQTVENMVQKNYRSVAARAIAVDIKSHHEQLKTMAESIRGYGDFSRRASKKINDNEQNIISRL